MTTPNYLLSDARVVVQIECYWCCEIAMHLYSLTLQKASCITQAIHGNFSGSKQQEVVVARGKTLEILRPDPNTGKVHSVLSVEAFGLVRSLAPFRMTGSSKGLP